MITRIETENFKGIGSRQVIDLKPVTLLFGPNSAGKSSIIHALLYAREVFERRNLNADRTLGGGAFVDLGGFRSFVHGRDLSRPVRLRFSLDLKNIGLPWFEVSPEGPTEGPIPVLNFSHRVLAASIEIEIAWSDKLKSPYCSICAVELNGQPFATIHADPEVPSVELTSLEVDHPILDPVYKHGEGPPSDEDIEPREWVDRIFRDRDDLGFPLEIVGQEEALPASDRALRFPFRRSHPRRSHPEQGSVWEDVVVELGWEPSLLSTLLTQLIVGPTERLREALSSFRYLGPLREPPPRNYEPPRSPDPSRWPSGLAAWDLLSRDAKLVEEASIWLSDEKRLDAGYGLRLFEYKELPIESPAFVRIGSTPDIDDLDMLKEEVVSLDTKRRLVLTAPTLDVLPSDVGVGISQLVPVIGLALDPETGMAAIEQPELHLHPRLQAEMGDLFIEKSREGKRLFLLETHSEHLLLRLLRRIRETGEGELPRDSFPCLTPDRIAVFYVETSDGQTKVQNLRVDETGEFIDRWPRGFFEERAKELF